jgi:WD40 repeat protein
MRTFDLPAFPHTPDWAQFSPDGRLLAVSRHGRVVVLDTTTGEGHVVVKGWVGKTGVAGVGFTADGSGVVHFDENTHDVRIFDLEKGKGRVLRPSRKVPWYSRGDAEICVTRYDGGLTFVAFNPEQGTAEIEAFDPISGERKFSFARHRSYIRELAVSPDGQWVAACSSSALRVWGIGGGKLPKRAAFTVHDNTQPCFGSLALSRDGAYLAAGSYGGGRVMAWDVKKKTILLTDIEARGNGGMAFAPDRPLLAIPSRVGDRGEVVFWDMRVKGEPRAFDWGIGPVGAVAFSPDGFRCAAASQDKVTIWDVDA